MFVFFVALLSPVKKPKRSTQSVEPGGNPVKVVVDHQVPVENRESRVTNLAVFSPSR